MVNENPRPVRPLEPGSVSAHRDKIVAQAQYFTASAMAGRGSKRYGERKTLQEAFELAREFANELGRPASVYAVAGTSGVHVENVPPDSMRGNYKMPDSIERDRWVNRGDKK